MEILEDYIQIEENTHSLCLQESFSFKLTLYWTIWSLKWTREVLEDSSGHEIVDDMARKVSYWHNRQELAVNEV